MALSAKITFPFFCHLHFVGTTLHLEYLVMTIRAFVHLRPLPIKCFSWLNMTFGAFYGVNVISPPPTFSAEAATGDDKK
jgi:hypothetical protein